MTFLLALFLTLAQAPHAEPFFAHNPTLRALYGSDMLTVRLEALRHSPIPEVRETGERLLLRDYPLVQTVLETTAPEAAERLESLLREIVETLEDGGEVDELLEEAREIVQELPAQLATEEERSSPSLLAARLMKLLLYDDGVAEGYEDAAEGDVEDYAFAYASLARVNTLWEELRGQLDDPDDLIAEVDEALEELALLIASPELPERFLDPEDAEEPSQRIVGLLERLTQSSLYPDRDLGRLMSFVYTLTEEGCAGDAAAFRASALYYREHLRRPLSVFFAETNEAILGGYTNPDACEKLLQHLEQARAFFGG